jgi:hypothetical protein
MIFCWILNLGKSLHLIIVQLTSYSFYNCKLGKKICKMVVQKVGKALDIENVVIDLITLKEIKFHLFNDFLFNG